MSVTARDSPAARSARTFGQVIAIALTVVTSTVPSTLRAGDPNGLVKAPLSLQPASEAPTLFSELSAAETGVVTENNYADPRMWWELYQEFSVGAMGTGVAIGDYDHDGRPDLFIVSKTESCRLFRNLGKWKFEDVTEAAGVADQDKDAAVWKQGAVFVDIDNDGRLDLYLCRFGAPNRLYMNQGDGSFTEEAAQRGLAVADASGMAAFADYDRDGWLDLYLQTNLLDVTKEPEGQPDRLFHNRGDGSFEEVGLPAGISGRSQGHSAIWWDYDDDGWPDLYVANDFAPPDRLYRNNRDGTFTDVIDRVVPHTPYSSMGSDLGDINNDGWMDLMVADMSASTHEADQRGMADSRVRSALSTPDDGSATAPQFLRNALYLNTGTGRCLEAATLAGLGATDWTWSIRWEDLDNDGWIDIHVTNGMNREQHNADLLMSMMTAESPTERIRLMRESPILAERNLVFRNHGNLVFEETGTRWGLGKSGVSFGAAFGDLDGDGDLDLVHTNYQEGATVLRNESPSGHRVIIELRGTRSNRFGLGARVRIKTRSGTQVRQLTSARGYLSSSEPIVHFGLGDEETIDQLIIDWPSGHRQEFSDLAADQRLTITEPDEPVHSTTDDPAVEVRQFTEVGEAIGFSLQSREAAVDGTMPQPLLPVRLHRRGPALAVGDLTGDGMDDLVLGGTPTDPARILVTGTAGRFTPVNPPGFVETSPLNDGPILVFDANGDGRNDLLITRGGANLPAGAPAYQPRLFLNTGQGLAPAPKDALPRLTMSVGTVVSADFNRDGKLDLFIGARVLPGLYPLAPRSALLLNRGGRFEDATDTLAPGLRQIGMVTAALWSDVDDDGWIDLLIAVEWGGVSFWKNRDGAGFADVSTESGFSASGSGWWTSLTAADFNGDGRTDYVAGNLGLNTLHQPTPDHPSLLYFGDFSGNGTDEIVEGYFEVDKLYPRRTRAELGRRIRPILKRFPRNDTFAAATLDEIFGADDLATAERFAATEARSGVFLSQADGTHLFSPLPRIAQIAPLQGIAAGDVDGDGHADIYALQNSYAPDLSIGRFDGGISQLLKGDGNGTFSPVAPVKSRLIVPGDAKALVVADFDDNGWPDFLVTRNNGTTLAFRNRGTPGHHAFQVRLKGPPGNPTGIGARITVILADGTLQCGEIHAGSGLVSQSTAGVFFGFAEGNPPREIRIRWPDGEETRPSFEPGKARVVYDF
ncbi:MAG: FG-GAP-like repeat-containing protein [Opitutaceae bacterium]